MPVKSPGCKAVPNRRFLAYGSVVRFVPDDGGNRDAGELAARQGWTRCFRWIGMNVRRARDDLDLG